MLVLRIKYHTATPDSMVLVRPSDIISTFGYASLVHPGNFRFRSLVASLRNDFFISTEEERTALVASLLSQIKAESRFLAQKPDGTWRVLSDREAVLRIRRQFRRPDDDNNYNSKKKAARQRKSTQMYPAPAAVKLRQPHSRPLAEPDTKPSFRPEHVLSRFGALASFLWVSFGQEYKDLEKMAFDIIRTLIFHESHEPSKPGEGLVLTADRPYGMGPFISCERRSYQRNTFADKVSVPTHDPHTHMVAAYGTGTGRSTIGTPPRSVFRNTHVSVCFLPSSF